MSNSISNNVMTIYKYTEANVSRDTTFTADTYYTFDNATKYTAKTKYESGNTYYTKEVLATSTITVEDSKLKTVTSKDKDNVDLVTSISKTKDAFILGKYVEATNLTKDAFNAGIYYTLTNSTYTQAKVYNPSTTYYEINTIAYVSGFTFSGTQVTNASLTTTGAFISCVITDQTLDSTSSTGSVNDFLIAEQLSNEIEISTPLAASTSYNTAGGTKRLYLYIFGVQLFDDATSNFLENSRNVYPFRLIITANQV